MSYATETGLSVSEARGWEAALSSACDVHRLDHDFLEEIWFCENKGQSVPPKLKQHLPLSDIGISQKVPVGIEPLKVG
jgi:hypothetical protein